jgi:hypothetical protein
MQTMSSQIPGTLYRSFTPDRSHHATALLLRDGSIVQIKDSALNNGARYTFPSYDAWVASRPDTIIEADTKNARGVIVNPADTHGFTYYNHKYNETEWTDWCYEIMLEGAPHLLEKEPVKTAFNALVELLKSHKYTFTSYSYLFKGVNRYKPNTLYDTVRAKMCGGLPFNLMPSRYAQMKLPQELIDGYTVLYNLIKDDLTPFLTAKTARLNLEYLIRFQQSQIKKTEKRIANYKDSIAYSERYIESCKKKVAELEATL